MRTHSVFVSQWQCRACAGLRYASEGGALLVRAYGTRLHFLELLYGPARMDRPEPWVPLVFTSPAAAAELGLCQTS